MKKNPTNTARDREMGRGGQPLGDRGRGNETWNPPPGEQGISNRPDDEGIEANPQGLAGEDDEEFDEEEDEFEDEGDGFEEDDDSSGRPA